VDLLVDEAKAIVGLRPSFSSHVRFGERGAPVDSLRVLLAGIAYGGQGGCSGLGHRQDAAGENAQKKCRGYGEQQGQGERSFRARHQLYWGIVGWLVVDRHQQTQVVVRGDATVYQADDRQPNFTGMQGRGEDVKLAEEAAGEGNADER
jgi:hypothetical protein